MKEARSVTDDWSYFYVLRGPRAGEYCRFKGTYEARIETAANWGIPSGEFKAGVRFRDGDFVMIPLTNLRQATPMEIICEERNGAF